MTRVLLIENDAPRMRLMAWALREEGFDVSTATTSDAAGTARDAQPAVIVFNTSEPSIEKAACIGQLRAASPARIIDLAEDATSPGHDSGADAYLELPVTAQQLIAAIQRLAPA